jgi:hypothetical protein
MWFLKNVMWFLRNLGIVAFLIAAAGVIFGLVQGSHYLPEQEMIFMGFVALIFLVLSFLLFALPKRCNKCKKWFAMKRDKNDVLNRSYYKKREVTGEIKSASTGAVIEKQYSDVNYTKDVLLLNWCCKYCDDGKKSRRVTQHYKS